MIEPTLLHHDQPSAPAGIIIIQLERISDCANVNAMMLAGFCSPLVHYLNWHTTPCFVVSMPVSCFSATVLLFTPIPLAVLEQFSSSSRAVLEQFPSSSRAVPEQFPNSSRAVPEQFLSNFFIESSASWQLNYYYSSPNSI